jgi:glycosyltransferase involved in cell wall biosynthesis
VKTVDVIIPCYNYGRFLRQCLDSVLTQQGCQVRVLIIDDASTDASLETARSLAEHDCRVTVMAHQNNRGHIATYNEGIEWVDADYMLLLSADDIVAPMALSRAVGLMEAHPNIGFVYGRFIRFTDETGRADVVAELPEGSSSKFSICKGSDYIRELCADPDNRVETVTAVVRTSLQKRLGGYRPELPHAGDYEMWLRMAAHGDIGIIDAVQGFVRIHAHNMRNGYEAKRMIGDYRQRQEALRAFFTSQASVLAEVDALAALAYRRLAEKVFWEATGAFEEGTADDAAQLAGLAKEIWPAIVRTPSWWKLSAKRLVGPRWWRAIGPSVDEARRLWSRRWQSS